MVAMTAAERPSRRRAESKIGKVLPRAKKNVETSERSRARMKGARRVGIWSAMTPRRTVGRLIGQLPLYSPGSFLFLISGHVTAESAVQEQWNGERGQEHNVGQADSTYTSQTSKRLQKPLSKPNSISGFLPRSSSRPALLVHRAARERRGSGAAHPRRRRHKPQIS